MEKLHTLKISTQESVPDATVLYFPRLLVGGSEAPSEGTMLFELEDENECAYSTAEVILAPTKQRNLVIISTRLEVIQRALNGEIISIECREQHQDFCKRLDGEAHYFKLDRGIIQQMEIQRESLQRVFSVFPDLENLCDRLNVIQITSGEEKVHVIPDHHSPAVLNASLVPRNGKYYSPSPQRVRFLRATEKIENAEEGVIAACNEEELKRFLPEAEVFQLPDEYKETVNLSFPKEIHLYVLQKVKIRTGYIARKYFENVARNESERALKDFMESL
jgi:hypothetical protein